jgi:hypothetical protein
MSTNSRSIPVSVRILMEDGQARNQAATCQRKPRTDRAFRALRRVGHSADWILKVAVILGTLYLLIRIGMAFLPGGAVERVLGGLR